MFNIGVIIYVKHSVINLYLSQNINSLKE